MDKNGNTEPVETLSFSINGTAPTTAAALTPPAVSGWYVDPTVALSATGRHGLGRRHDAVPARRRRPHDVPGPFQVTGRGRTRCRFVSTDRAGKDGTAETRCFVVDSVAPVTTAALAAAASRGERLVPRGGAGRRCARPTAPAARGSPRTAYSVDGGSPQAYSGPVTISARRLARRQFSVDGRGRERRDDAVGHGQGRPDRPGDHGDARRPRLRNGWYATPTRDALRRRTA